MRDRQDLSGRHTLLDPGLAPGTGDPAHLPLHSRRTQRMATRRTRARETALQMLYQHDLNPGLSEEVIREQVLERLEDEALARFAWSLYRGVLDQRTQLDAAIEKVAANWSLRRMAPTDRNVLRLGTFELRHTDTPPRVIIDEAIEMARKYGSAQSPPFVNGILDRLIPREGARAAAIPLGTDHPDAPAAPPPADVSDEELFGEVRG